MRKTLLLTTVILAVFMSYDVNAMSASDVMRARFAAIKAARLAELQKTQVDPTSVESSVVRQPVGAVPAPEVDRTTLVPHGAIPFVQSSDVPSREGINTREVELGTNDRLQKGVDEITNDGELVMELEKISSSISDVSEDEKASKLSGVCCG